MSSSFAYSFDQFSGDSPLAAGTHSFSTVAALSHPPDESFALREWRRQNAIRLEEKERREKELRSQIIARADEYKVEFYRKRQAGCEANKVTNQEKEKACVAMQEKFHGEADKDYWKAIAEMIPKNAPTIERRSVVKKYEEKKKAASIVVVQGPKPGKPSDLSRMREIILKLKHNTPPHLNLSP